MRALLLAAALALAGCIAPPPAEQVPAAPVVIVEQAEPPADKADPEGPADGEPGEPGERGRDCVNSTIVSESGIRRCD